jgi:hypothetical protein
MAGQAGGHRFIISDSLKLNRKDAKGAKKIKINYRIEESTTPVIPDSDRQSSLKECILDIDTKLLHEFYFRVVRVVRG